MKRSSETRNECYISCRVVSLKVPNEFLLNENAIERIDETLIKLVVQTSLVAVKYLWSGMGSLDSIVGSLEIESDANPDE